MLYPSILETIGRTPCVRLNRLARHLSCSVYAKCEFMNPGGSIKDRIGYQMVAAAEPLMKTGFTFLVRDHPMTPYSFTENENFKKADQPFHAYDNLSAVVFAATTVGLEAVLAGLPTIRFRPSGRLALDILPAEIEVVAADADGLAEALKSVAAMNLDRDKIFSPPAIDKWRNWLAC